MPVKTCTTGSCSQPKKITKTKKAAPKKNSSKSKSKKPSRKDDISDCSCSDCCSCCCSDCGLSDTDSFTSISSDECSQLLHKAKAKKSALKIKSTTISKPEKNTKKTAKNENKPTGRTK